MAINPVGPTPSGVAFKGKPEPGTGGAGKAWTSAFIPGLGQFLDGRNGAGAGFMGGTVAAFGLTGYGAYRLIEKGVNTKNIVLTACAGAALAVLKLCDIINAYKGRKNA